MRAGASGPTGVADGARIERAVMPLQADELEAILGLRTGCDGVCAIVAGLAVDTAVFFGHAIQRLILIVFTGRMAVDALRFVEPRLRILSHVGHGAVAIDARLCVRRRQVGHDVAQASSLRTGVAVVAAIEGVKHNTGMSLVHRLGQAGHIASARRADRVG